MANSSDRFLYFLVGGFVGASVALLFAPKSGEETRRLLEDKYREGTRKMGQSVKDSSEYVREVVRTGGESVSGAISEGRESITRKKQEIGDKVSGALSKGKESIARTKDQLSAAVEAGKKAYTRERGEGGEEAGAES